MPILRKAAKEEPREVKMKAKVIKGVLRGHSLIEIHYHRLIGVLRKNIIKGTFDLKLEKPINIEHYSTKQLDHRMVSGYNVIDAYLAPIIISSGEKKLKCWAIREGVPIYRNDILEIISSKNIREEFGLKDGDDVEVTMFLLPPKRGMKMIKHKIGKLSKIKRG